MIEAATTGLGTAIDWIGTVVSGLLASDGKLSALMPLIGINIGISALMLGIKAIRSFSWGM